MYTSIERRCNVGTGLSLQVCRSLLLCVKKIFKHDTSNSAFHQVKAGEEVGEGKARKTEKVIQNKGRI